MKSVRNEMTKGRDRVSVLFCVAGCSCCGRTSLSNGDVRH